MFYHRKFNWWQRFVMARRNISEMAKCNFQCPGCGSSNTTGSYPTSWVCHNCGASGQS